MAEKWQVALPDVFVVRLFVAFPIVLKFKVTKYTVAAVATVAETEIFLSDACRRCRSRRYNRCKSVFYIYRYRLWNMFFDGSGGRGDGIDYMETGL